MSLRVSCPGPVFRLSSFGGGGWPGPFVPLPGSTLLAYLWVRLCVWGGLKSPGGVGGGGLLGGRRPSCCLSWGRGSAWVGRRAPGVGARPSLCLPCTGTKAGFVGVA